MRKFLAVLIAAGALGACAGKTETVAAVEPAGSADAASAEAIAALAPCAAEHLVHATGLPYVADGQTPPATGAFVRAADLPPVNRVVPFGHMMTRDYRMERLTVLLDQQGRILRLRCE